MSMNFGRELSLLRIRLTEAGSAERAAEREAATGSASTFLGAEEDEIRAAAEDLVENFPQMGRAQMTAFVRTLWQSNVYELQAVGGRILAARATLLEPADQPLVADLVKKCDVDGLAAILAEALGTLTAKNKKVWRDLRKMAAGSDARLRRAAVRACRTPVLADESLFSRMAELLESVLGSEDPEPETLGAVDELLAALAKEHSDAVREIAERHGRKIKTKKAAPKSGKKAGKKK